MKAIALAGSMAIALLAAASPVGADPVSDVFDQLTGEQILDGINMGMEWCDYIKYSDTPVQGAMMAMDDAHLNLGAPPHTAAAMVWVGIRYHCQQYIPDVASAAQTWERRQRYGG